MILGIAFDMDGTLTKPKIDFARIRAELGLTDPSRPLFEQILELEEPRRAQALAVLERAELEAGREAEANPGLYPLIEYLEKNQIKKAIFTRSSSRALELTLSNLKLSGKFFPLVTRDLNLPLKPSPAPIQYILEQWQFSPEQILVVGDYVLDLQSGKNAGARTVYLQHQPSSPSPREADFVITRLDQLISILEELNAR